MLDAIFWLAAGFVSDFGAISVYCFCFFFSFLILCGLIAVCVVGFQFWTHCFCLQAEFFVNVVLILGLVAEFFFLNFFAIFDGFSSEKKDML